MRRLVIVIALVSCGGKKKEDKRPKGKLCFAANTAESFKWEKDGAPADYMEGRPMAIKYRGKPIALPNTQQGFDDAREGEPVAVMRDDRLVESWKVNFQRLGNDLCYYWRGFDPAKPDRKPGWILDANGTEDRCTCYEPAAGSGSNAGSAR
jgi:hypothetical protein